MQHFLIAGGVSPTNVRLLEAVRALAVHASLLPVEDVVARATAGDAVLARLDVRPTLDGVDPGVTELRQLEDAGVHVLNPSAGLFAAHDKLLTAIRLGEAGLPHPRTALVDERPPHTLEPPLVVKPRFGSWGEDVLLCRTGRELRRTLRRLRKRAWFRHQGALAQELVPPLGEDLRVVVAGGAVVGAIKRVAPEGEWRTNVSLGARRVATSPPADARGLALAAARAVGGDFLGVDLLPTPGGWVIVEVNGCVDLTDDYSLDGGNVFGAIASALVARAAELAAPPAPAVAQLSLVSPVATV